VPPVRGTRGRPRRRPDVVLADRGYDHDKYRRLVRELGIRPLIARRNTEHGSGLGTQRWVVERAFALLHHFRRLRIRWEIRDDMHEALLSLGCALICWRRLASLRRSSKTAVRGDLPLREEAVRPQRTTEEKSKE
jgi:transposase